MANITIAPDSDNAQEEGTLVLNIAWYDEDGNAVTPSAATWTLTDLDGNVINSRQDVSISSLSTSNDVVLKGDDLAISPYGVNRQLLAKWTYTSSAGSGLPATHAYQFKIDNMSGVT